MNEYILQNVHAKYVGNCILFWRKNGAGYTPDLDDAEIFTKEEAERTVRYSDTGKFRMFEKSYLESISERHVDMQDLEIIGNVHEVSHE